MKLAEIDSKIADKFTKEIKYFNFDLVVPVRCNYIATDEDGDINAFTDKPTSRTKSGYWSSGFDGFEDFIGNILEHCNILNGTIKDWKNSLREI